MRGLCPTITLIAVALITGACHKSATSPGDDGDPNTSPVANAGTVEDYLMGAQFAGAFGTQTPPSPGTPPSTAAGPSVTVSGTTTLSNIGSVAAFSLSADAPFQRIILTVPGKSGYLALDMPSAKTDQGISIFFQALPPALTLQFQVGPAVGSVGPVASLALTTIAGGVANLVASANPDPLPFSGKTCTIMLPADPNFGCAYETRLTVVNQGEAALTLSEYSITWIYGGAAAGSRTNTFTTLGGQTQIAGSGGFVPVNAMVRCSLPTCDGSFFAPVPGKMFIRIKGTDSAGHPIDFQSQNFTLAAQ